MAYLRQDEIRRLLSYLKEKVQDLESLSAL